MIPLDGIVTVLYSIRVREGMVGLSFPVIAPRQKANPAASLTQRRAGLPTGRLVFIGSLTKKKRQNGRGNTAIAPACQPCNSSKGARLLIEWRPLL
jgi:hypothetical protein